MHAIDIRKIDLNLLIALEALLIERNVTRAARRIGRTQPAMSHALARLRDLLGDPLLVRQGRSMVPTLRAQTLGEPLARALSDLERTLSDDGGFDPATTTRTFRLVCPDLLAAFLPELLSSLRAEAPHVRLRVVLPAAAGTARALEVSDLALAPDGLEGAGLMRTGLGRLSFVVLARRGHPGIGSRLTPARWLAFPHVQVGGGEGAPSVIDRALEAAGLARTVGLSVPSFLSAVEVVARTDYFFTAPGLVRGLTLLDALAVHRPPIALPELAVAAYWEERLGADAGHRWFRQIVVREASRAITTPDASARRPKSR